MNNIKVLGVLIASALQTLPALASTQPLPSTFAGSTTDFIAFGDSAFPSSNLICFSAGCGGAFQGTVYGPGAVSASGAGILTTVWCVDYQLDVTTGSQYIANITTLNDINAATQSNVRYGTLDSVSPPAPGWLNTVTDTLGLDGGDANSAAYRYTLAAALVSQYVDSGNVANPTNLNGSSPVNTAIQEAIWYITYNNEYPGDGATWPPESDISSLTCGAGQNALNSSGNTNYACWVRYAEANAGSVKTNAWAVISGPTNAGGTLQAPAPLNGVYNQYPSYQTFLVQVTPGNPTPEPAYFVLTFGLGAFILFVRRRRIGKQA